MEKKYIILIISLLFCVTCEMPEKFVAVKTGESLDVAASHAKVSGQIIDYANGINAYGHCWSSTNPNPTLESKEGFSNLGDSTFIGEFKSDINGLTAATTYYVTAYATSSSGGTVYGNARNFTTDGFEEPSVITTIATAITNSAATSGGDVTSDGGASVTARGVCWSTAENPTIDNNKTSNGTGTGSFISSLSGLAANTSYYLRAYATNSAGTSYGAQISFTTTNNSIAVQTKEIVNITAISATSGGIITSTGGTTITDKGICYSDYPAPTTADKKVSAGTGATSFDAALSILIPNKTYYVRAYATNSLGTVYGEQKTFTALDAYYEGFETGAPGVITGAWSIVSVEAIESAYCLNTNQNQAEVSITRTLLNDGQLYFYVKGTRVTINYNTYTPSIKFFIDDVEQATFSNTTWEMKSFPVTAGIHTFKWRNNVNYGNPAYIDYIIMPK
jgi:hypothetical protein